MAKETKINTLYHMIEKLMLYVKRARKSTKCIFELPETIPVSILYKSTVGRYRPVSYPDGPITARCRFIKNASWDSNPENLTYNLFFPVLCVCALL